jgi:hypothetical protein
MLEMSELGASSDKKRGKGTEDVRAWSGPGQKKGKGARMGGKKGVSPCIEVH